MKKTVPPSKSEKEAVRRFEREIKSQGEAAAMLDNLQREASGLARLHAVFVEASRQSGES